MSDLAAKNKKSALIVAGMGAGMLGLSFAAVPLYEIFCQVTGYGGYTQKAEAATVQNIGDRKVKIRFVANVNRDMPWQFEPTQTTQEIKVGERTMATYAAMNPTKKKITGTAVFNVSPFKVGEYFNKVDCFCFTEQTLLPGQEVEMPVDYFVDESFADDPYMDDVTEITLSYTFYLSGAEDMPEVDHNDDHHGNNQDAEPHN
jgi:cytochrome c oxidase assembly protein subunit 11